MNTNHRSIQKVLGVGFALALAIVSLAAPARAEEGAETPPEAPKPLKKLSPDQLISDQCVFYIHTPNFAKAKKAFMRSAFYGLLSEDEVQKELKDTIKKLKESYIKGDGARTDFEMGRRSAEMDLLNILLDKYVEEQVALAIEVPLAANKEAPPPDPRWLVVISLPSGDDAENKRFALSDQMERFLSTMDIARFKDNQVKVGDYTVQELRCADLSLDESWCFVENLFLYGQGKGVVADAVRNYAENHGKGTLSQNDGYHAAISRSGEGAQVYLQVDVSSHLKKELEKQPFLDQFLKNIEQNRPQMALGVNVGEGENAPIKEKVLLRVPRGAPPPPCKSFTASLCSSDVVFYHARQGALNDFFKPAIQMVQQNGPDGQPGPFAGFLPEFMRALGVANEDEVFKALDPFQGEVSFFVNYLPGESIEKNFQDVFQMVFACEIKRTDIAAATDTLERLKRGTRLEYKKLSYQGEEIWYQFGAKPDEAQRGGRTVPLLTPVLPFGTQGETRPEGSPFFVSYALVKLVPSAAGEQERQFVLFSDNLQAVQKAVQQVKMAKQSLQERKEFKDLMAGFSDNRYAVTFVDLPRLSDTFFHVIFPAMAKRGVIGRQFFNKLPSDNTVRSHLSPMAWASSAPNEGDLIEFVSPTGNLPLLGLVSAIAWPAINAERQMQISAQIDDNFKRIGLAINLFAADFDRYPQQLSDLVPNYISFTDFRRIFNSPFNPNQVLRKEDVDDPAKTNLHYVPGHSLQDMSRDVILYEEQPTFARFTDLGVKTLHHVLQIDGKVRFKSTISLQRLLKGQVELPMGLDEEASKSK
ncbi:MAG: hypothetical protein KIS92_03100 [Planctomycetota bacterium]|nr:hypothetical protein [Planctomycetota bacterium]